MKSPWHIGLLVLAITGVSAYDVIFIMNRSKDDTSAHQTASAPPLTAPAGPAPAVLFQSETPVTTTDSLPPISREEVLRLSQQAYAPKNLSASEIEEEWPVRDPFTNLVSDPEPAINDKPIEKAAPVVEKLPEPQCTFSGVMIGPDKRVALVNGIPLSIGARLGVWQLARIEQDHIILAAGKETRRIGLN
jgi:hypothetical protein